MKWHTPVVSEWRRWFAWHPVQLGEWKIEGGNTYAWLCVVERKFHEGYGTSIEYRETDDE